MHHQVIDALRNAAASGNLLIVTGAGISQGLSRADGRPLPSWGALVTALRARADPARLAAHDALLDELLPLKALEKVHGDALIEASEIMQASFGAGEFEEAIAELCREEAGSCTQTHLAIAGIAPAGVITFNYDQGHEEAFRRQATPVEAIRYDEPDKLKRRLATGHRDAPFVLKAHGCISAPPSLVLTSSSYRAVLSGNRAYRLFLQHAFARYTVLIVGFALRDRDFDQLMSVLEIELGRPAQTHAFIAKRPDPTTEEGLVKRADWAAVTARFGLQPLYVDEFSEIPDLLCSLGTQPGSLIGRLVAQSASADGNARAAAHDQAINLGRIGRAQLRSALLDRLAQPGVDLTERSELLYAFRGIVEGDVRVHALLLDALRHAGANAAGPQARLHAECAAHALAVIRGLRVKPPAELDDIVATLNDHTLLDQLRELDLSCDVPRLHSYAIAAAAELLARHQS